MKILPSDGSYKTFCDMITGYRMFSVVMQAVESGMISIVGHQPCTVEYLVAASGMKEEEGKRFIALLANAGILENHENCLHLSRFARIYLHQESEFSQRNVLEFEQLLVEKWNNLGLVLSEGQGCLLDDKTDDEYLSKLNLFQKAMNEAASVRAGELWDALPAPAEEGLIIDVGAGGGVYLKKFLSRYPLWRAIACDLPDVLELNAVSHKECGILPFPCNILDPAETNRLLMKHEGSASLLILSNVIHCYSPEENSRMIGVLGGLLKEDGMIVAHDFFRDGNIFGALYDLHMMVNTYNGRAYSFDEVLGMLGREGFCCSDVIELPSHSHAIVAARAGVQLPVADPVFAVRRAALSLGFFHAVPCDPASMEVEQWVLAKCAYGCPVHGKKWSCPPHSLNGTEFRELAGSYAKALLVAGQPPLLEFQESLLELEKSAFLSGFKKALAFTGGPCSFCEACDERGCIHPEKRRPSLESCGVDVFALAEKCGLQIGPLKNSSDFVQYVGMLFLE